MKRSLVRAIGRGLIGMLLFTQLLVSAHACTVSAAPADDAYEVSAVSLDVDRTHPSVDFGDAAVVSADDRAVLSDPPFANLCGDHCRQGKQSDHFKLPTLPVALLRTLYLRPLTPAAAEAPRRATVVAHDAAAAAPPPLAILNCCFRL